jgi:hypothetical protein
MKEYEIGGVCCTSGEDKEVDKILFGKPEGKRQLGRPRSRWDNNYNIKMDTSEIGW